MGLKVNQIHKMRLYHRPIMSPISLKLPYTKKMEACDHYLCEPGSLSVPWHLSPHFLGPVMSKEGNSGPWPLCFVQSAPTISMPVNKQVGNREGRRQPRKQMHEPQSVFETKALCFMKIPPCGKPFAKPPVSAWLDHAGKASLRVSREWQRNG